MEEIIIEDMIRRYEKNKDEDFTKDYLHGIELLIGKEEGATPIIENVKKKLDDRNFIICISEYLSNSSVGEIFGIVDNIKQDDKIADIRKGDVLYGIGEMFVRRNERPWNYNKNKSPSTIRMQCLENSLEFYEKSERKPWLKYLYKEIGNERIKLNGGTKKAIEYYDKVMNFILEEFPEKEDRSEREFVKKFAEGKLDALKLESDKNAKWTKTNKIMKKLWKERLNEIERLENSQFCRPVVFLEKEELLYSMNEILMMMENTFINGEEEFISKYSHVTSNLFEMNSHHYGLNDPDNVMEGLSWDEKLRNMCHGKLVREFASVARIPTDWKEEERGEEYRRNTYRNQQVDLYWSKFYEAEMIKIVRSQLKIESDKIGKSGELEFYKIGITGEIKDDKLLNLMTQFFREKEYAEQLAGIFSDMEEERLLELLENVIQTINSIPISQEETPSDWFVDYMNNIIGEERQKKQKVLKLEEDIRKLKLKVYYGLFGRFLEENGVKALASKELTNYIEDMIKCSEEERDFVFIIKSYRLLMYNLLGVSIHKSLRLFEKQNELNKMFGDRIDGIDHALNYVDYLYISGYKEEAGILGTRTRLDYETYQLAGLYNNNILEERGVKQLKRMRN